MASKAPMRHVYNKKIFGKTDLIRIALLARPQTTTSALKHIVEIVFGETMSLAMLRVIKFRLKRKGVEFPDGRLSKKS